MYRTLYCFSILCALLLSACSGSNKSDTKVNTIFEEAQFISGDSLSSGVAYISIDNPWDTTSNLADYILVNSKDGAAADYDKIEELRKSIGGNLVKLDVPMKRMIVYSAVHAALLCEMGYADAIVGVADASYIKTPEILERLADGRITDIGSSMEPSLEKIIALKPDAILISPFQNQNHGVVEKTNIPVIECADYMETTPLGRAEWSKFYAMLAQGVADSNSAIYNDSKARYNALRQEAAKASGHPRVITEIQNKGTWVVPGGGSYAARLISDAGGVYPFSDNSNPGSTPMSYEMVFRAAQDADIWLIKHFGSDFTLKNIAENQPFNKEFWAYKNGGIYFCDSSTANLFEETPFHPERLLSDYVAIFHKTGAPLRYYQQVKP